MTVSVAISESVRYARINVFLISCTAIDGFLMLNVRNSHEQHSVRMHKLEVVQSQLTLRTEPDTPEDNSLHPRTLGAGYTLSTENLNENMSPCI
jgi:hypothetical protein